MKNISKEKDVLLQYVSYEYGNPELALSVLDMILSGNNVKLDKVQRDIAEFISKRTSYLSINVDPDIDVEIGDWGIPQVTSAGETFLGVQIEDKESLVALRREVDNEFNKTAKKVEFIVSKKVKPKWVCQKCGRFLGIEFLSTEEVQKMLDRFSMGKYQKCRSCKTLNYFTLDSKGIEFKTKLD